MAFRFTTWRKNSPKLYCANRLKKKVLALRRCLTSINTNPKAARILSEWGLRLDHTVLQVKGRVMEPEKIHLCRAIFPADPQYDWPKNDTLMDVGRKMAMEIKPEQMISLQNDRTDAYVNRIRECINSQVTFHS